MRRLLLVGVALLGVGLPTVPAVPASAGSAMIGLTAAPLAADRDAMVRSYVEVLDIPPPEIGWTGSTGACAAGSVSAAYRRATFERINWYRALAGLLPVAEDPALVPRAQQAALMMHAAQDLDHDPPSWWPCYSSVGDQAASSSNLALGSGGPEAIDRYVRDDRAASVGHRRWILRPQVTTMAAGDVPTVGGRVGANALWVFGSEDRARIGRQGTVLWPSAGYFPAAVLPPRWSFAASGIGGLVAPSVTIRAGDAPIPVRVVANDTTGTGAELVFEPDAAAVQAARASTTDTVFDVVISASGQQWGYRVSAVPVVTPFGSPDPANPLPSSSRRYVETVLTAFLGTSPAEDRVAVDATRLEAGTSVATYLAEVTASEEWLGAIVERFYRDTLHRSPDPAGRNYWIAQLRAGLPVAAAAAAFYGSAEYVDLAGGSLAAWVTDLYAVLLRRVVDDAGRTYWSQRALSRGTATVALELYQSIESRQRRVDGLYRLLLDRAPDAEGRSFWTARLADGNDLALARNLAASEEYWRNATG